MIDLNVNTYGIQYINYDLFFNENMVHCLSDIMTTT